MLESLFIFPCEYCKIKHFYRTPLVAASVSTPCFFLKLFMLFAQLYYLFHYLNKTLYLSCITNLIIFLVFFCILTKQANIRSKSTFEQQREVFSTSLTPRSNVWLSMCLTWTLLLHSRAFSLSEFEKVKNSE